MYISCFPGRKRSSHYFPNVKPRHIIIEQGPLYSKTVGEVQDQGALRVVLSIGLKVIRTLGRRICGVEPTRHMLDDKVKGGEM